MKGPLKCENVVGAVRILGGALPAFMPVPRARVIAGAAVAVAGRAGTRAV